MASGEAFGVAFGEARGVAFRAARGVAFHTAFGVALGAAFAALGVEDGVVVLGGAVALAEGATYAYRPSAPSTWMVSPGRRERGRRPGASGTSTQTSRTPHSS